MARKRRRKQCGHEYHGDTSRTGGSKGPTRFYRTWQQIKGRCLRPEDPAWLRYGGRGIGMHEPWIASYTVFKAWLLENLGLPRPGESLDRINNDGNYEPGNLRWSDHKRQSRNRRNTILLTIASGETRPLCDWAEMRGVRPSMIKHRIDRGWSVDKAIFTPVMRFQPES